MPEVDSQPTEGLGIPDGGPVDLAVVVITHRGQVDPNLLASVAPLHPAEIHLVSSNEDQVGRPPSISGVTEHHFDRLLPPGEARNVGADASRAANLLFLDHDVVLNEGALDVVREFVSDEEAEIVGGLYEIDRQEPAAARLQNAILSYRFLDCRQGREAVLSTSHLLVKRSRFEHLGGFHERMTSQEDLEFCSRAIDLGIATTLRPDFLAKHRKVFTTGSLLGDYLSKAFASIGFRRSNRATMVHSNHNITPTLVVSLLSSSLAVLVAVLLWLLGWSPGRLLVPVVSLLVLGLPWPLFWRYFRTDPGGWAYGMAIWPWIGWAATGGSLLGLGRSWWSDLARICRAGLDDLIALKRVLIRKGLPVQLVLYCTAVCNLRCNHCFYKETLDRPGRGELDWGVLEDLVQRAGPLLWLSLGGGEPLLRKDLLPLCRMMVTEARPKFFSFPTNGYFVEKTHRFALRLLQSFPRSSTRFALFVSIDGPEEIHDRIRGEGSYRRALETLDRLRGLKRWYDHFHVNVVTTITPDNADVAESFVEELLDEARPDALSINLFRYHDLEHPPLEEGLVASYERALEAYDRWRNENGPAGYGFLSDKIHRLTSALQKAIILRVARDDEFVTPCTAGELSYVVMEDGSLKPCEILSTELGKVTETSFADLSTSEEAIALRRWIRDTECRCTYECANTTNALFSWPMTRRWLEALVFGRSLSP